MTSKNTSPAAGDDEARKQSDLGGSNCFQNERLDEQTQAQSWRDVLPIHPAAELFPLMSQDELEKLTEDIRNNGLRFPVAVWKCPHGRTMLLDGRNRLDALERVLGVPVVRRDGDALEWAAPHKHLPSDIDPYAYVISANIHRRHLTAEERNDLIRKLLKAKPEISNLQIAKQVKRDDKTVAKIRREMEERSEIPNVEARTDTKGRKQPAKKKRLQESFEPLTAYQAEAIAEQVRRIEKGTDDPQLASEVGQRLADGMRCMTVANIRAKANEMVPEYKWKEKEKKLPPIEKFAEHLAVILGKLPSPMMKKNWMRSRSFARSLLPNDGVLLRMRWKALPNASSSTLTN
jgi:hypothetical protein